MKVFPIVDLESDWYPKSSLDAFKRHSSLDFVDGPEKAESIWVYSYYHEAVQGLLGPAGRRSDLGDKLILGSFHHLPKDKEWSWGSKARLLDGICDAVHFFSRRNIVENRERFKKPMLLLPYWIDTRRFHPLPPSERADIRAELGIPEGKTVIGSFQRDTEKDGGPKLEKGPDVLCGVMEKLDPKEYFVLLAGPRRGYVERRLRERGAASKSLGPVAFEEMNRLYNCLDYYLVTSRCEGGPQAVLECMAAKTKVYSTDVGISDILSEGAVRSGPEDFASALRGEYAGDVEEHHRSVSRFECSKVVREYESAFGKMLEARSTGRDLRGSVKLDWF